jgi:hypothetical protein
MYTVKRYVDAGSRSSFYKLNQRGKGFKTFWDKESAEYAHSVQSELSMSDLAPRVYSEVGRIRIGNKLSDWGYITEVAKTITPHDVNCDCENCETLEERYREEIDTLVSDIEEAGYYFGDCHTGNVGYVKREGYTVLVCIDTGEESVNMMTDSNFDDDYEEDESRCSCTVCRRQYA